MHWVIAAPFFTAKDSQWLDDFADAPGMTFEKVYRFADGEENWHDRKIRTTSSSAWKAHWRQARTATAQAPDGIVTVFPQLALLAAIRKTLFGGRFKILAWCFNVGAKPGGLKLLISKIFLKRIDRFVVHSRGEIETLHAWFGIDRARIAFVPLQRAPIAAVATEDLADPFIVSMGSANRDYETLVSAVEGTGIPCRIIASPRVIPDREMPVNVELGSGLTPDECLALAQRARISVIPLDDVDTASGQVTIVEAMRMSRPVIATRGVGSVDYIEDGVDGVLVAPRDADALRAAIVALWNDADLRERLAHAGRKTAETRFSDEAAATALVAILGSIGGPKA